MPATSYCQISDLDNYYEDFTLDFYGTFLNGSTGTVLTAGTTNALNDITRVFRHINEYLDAVQSIKTVPVGTQAETGAFPESIIEWNAKGVIWDNLRKRHAHEAAGEYPEWVTNYRDDTEAIRIGIISGDIVWRDAVSIAESGIGIPSIATRTGIGTFYNNYDMSDPYTGGDFKRTFVIEIDGTTAGNTIGHATFKWSYDNGITWEDTNCDTGTAWIDLVYNVKIRWSADSGTANQCNNGDRWSFACIPLSVISYGAKEYVKAKTFFRGV